MYVIPAIDLLEGKCVRLIQGEYHRRITYEDDPVKQAKAFSSTGARWLHIIDLGGAKVGKPVNTDSIAAIAALNQQKIEVGGGIRDEASIKQLLELGVERVLFGSDGTMEGSVGKIVDAKISDEDRKLIFWGNAERILAEQGKKALNPLDDAGSTS